MKGLYSESEDRYVVQSGTYNGRCFVILGGIYPLAYVQTSLPWHGYWEDSPDGTFPNYHTDVDPWSPFLATWCKGWVGWDYGHVGQKIVGKRSEGAVEYTIDDIMRDVRRNIDRSLRDEGSKGE